MGGKKQKVSLGGSQAALPSPPMKKSRMEDFMVSVAASEEVKALQKQFGEWLSGTEFA